MIETFALSYQITLEEPALLTSLSGDPNSAVSLSYLPGSVLRGAAVAAWLSAHPNRTVSGWDNPLSQWLSHDRERRTRSAHSAFVASKQVGSNEAVRRQGYMGSNVRFRM